jgi:hypothetical protein
MFNITKTSFDGAHEKIIYQSGSFDKEEIKKAFINAVNEMTEDGEEIEYWKDSKECPCESMLSVTMRKGKPMTLITKGTNYYYKTFNADRL